MQPTAAFRDLDSRFKWLTAFFRSYHCFFALHPLCDELDDGDDGLDLLPFHHLSNVLLYDTVINWCKIFGVDNEDCHWKRVVKDHGAFRTFLFFRIDTDPAAFRKYQESVLDFRNKWIVHFDPQYDHGVVPKLDVAYQTAIALHEYLRKSPMDTMYYSGPEDMTQFGSMVASKFLQKLHGGETKLR